MFRKRSTRARISRPVIAILVVIGLIWLIPWLTLSSTVNSSRVEASKDQPEQAGTNDQAEQETISDQPKDEEALKDTPPPKEEGVSNNLLPSPPIQPPSSPAQPSLPSPPPLSPPKVEEVPKSVLSSNAYWDYGSNYWDYRSNYWYYEPSYRDYESNYWDYEPGYWDYWLDY